MVALLGLLAPGCRQRAPSASGSGSGQVQPWGPSTSAQLVRALNHSATPALRLGRGSGRRTGAGAGMSSRASQAGSSAGSRTGSAHWYGRRVIITARACLVPQRLLAQVLRDDRGGGAGGARRPTAGGDGRAVPGRGGRWTGQEPRVWQHQETGLG